MALNKKIFRKEPDRERTPSRDFRHKAIKHRAEFGCCTLQR